jgi:hypothetical protein
LRPLNDPPGIAEVEAIPSQPQLKWEKSSRQLKMTNFMIFSSRSNSKGAFRGPVSDLLG